jgi:hypothetical protein
MKDTLPCPTSHMAQLTLHALLFMLMFRHVAHHSQWDSHKAHHSLNVHDGTLDPVQ